MGLKLPYDVVKERNLYGANPWQVFDPENYPWILNEVSCDKFEKIAYAFVKLTKKAADSNNKSKLGRENYIKKVGCGTWGGKTPCTEIKDFDDHSRSFQESTHTKKNTVKMDVVVTDSVQTCHNDDAGQTLTDYDFEDLFNRCFVVGEDGKYYCNMPDFEFGSNLELEVEQTLEDITTKMGKRKLQAETSYVVSKRVCF
ncbi:hypothetical protein POM88_040662 [Heracleum sosnowskyi]|uniref:Uncharacterized protein n=1 Tax=Heracleum sosnowskyi TaxID=360622 RepID=A0AAD8M905_9APIA|nr:hypothetical protein POM88_040662 [Heracleum sosnowskyi]